MITRTSQIVVFHFLFIIFFISISPWIAYGQCEIQEIIGPNPEGISYFGESLDAAEGVMVATADGVSFQIPASNGGQLFRSPDGEAFVLQTVLRPGLQSGEGQLYVYSAATNGTFCTFSGGNHVYAYRIENGVPLYEQQLSAFDDVPAFFGKDVSLSGDTMLVGAPASLMGGGYVFTYANGLWQPQHKLLDPIPEEGDLFGQSVALSGDTALIGAHGNEYNGHPFAGSAFIFRRQNGEWSFLQELGPADAKPNGGSFWFGWSADLDAAADTAIIGARMAQGGKGAAYVFEFNGREWVQTRKLIPDADGQFEDAFFGEDVAISDDGNTIIVGAQKDINDIGIASGAAYFYRRINGEWVEVMKFNKPYGFCIGARVAIDGDRAFVSDACGLGEAAGGEIYVFAGIEYIDCNDNGTPDSCDIADGMSLDSDFNGVPDECQTLPDLNQDGHVDGSDLGLLLAAWGEKNMKTSADFNGDTVVDGSDLGVLLGA